MREAISPKNRPRIVADKYICDVCGNGVRMIAFQGGKFVCQACKTADKEKQQAENTEE